MKKLIYLTILIGVAACQSIVIQNKSYKKNTKHIELGELISEKGLFKLSTTPIAFPTYENKIRVNIETIPFNKKIAKRYLKLYKNNQNSLSLNYSDSLPTKPEIIVIELADKTAFINELNKEINQQQINLIKAVSSIKAVTGLACYATNENSNKIKQADAIYLNNNQEAKYTLALYKEGKKIENIDLTKSSMLGYQASKFCWTTDYKGKWELLYLVPDCKTCEGNTTSEVTLNKKIKNLHQW